VLTDIAVIIGFTSLALGIVFALNKNTKLQAFFIAAGIIIILLRYALLFFK